jgi:signal transduction histidine kinase
MERMYQSLSEHAGAMAYLSSALYNHLDLEWIYKTACEGLARAMAIEPTFIMLYDEPSQTYQLASTFLDGVSHSIQQDQSLTAAVFEQSSLKIGIPVVIRSGEGRSSLQELDFPPVEGPRVLVLASLNHEGTNIGILGASCTDQTRNFLPEEALLVQAIADQVAAAIVHTRLFLTTRKQTLFLKLTNEIALIALSGGNLKEMLDWLAKQVVKALFADGCYISLWDPKRKSLVPYTAWGPNAQDFLLHATKTEEPSITQTALDLGRTIIANEPNLATTEVGESNLPRVAVLALPLWIGDRKLGAIRIEYPQLHSFISPEDLTRWEDIALQVTLVINHFQSMEQEKKLRQEAELLQRATVAITSSLDLEEVLSQILTSLEQGVPFDSAAICLIEEDHLRIAALGGSAWHTRKVGDLLDKSAGLFSLLETAHYPMYLSDATQHSSYEKWSKDGEVTIHGWMGVPLIANDHPIGYLMLNNRESNIYTPDHARLAWSFASQAAVAIEKVRLFEQVRNGRERMHALSKKLVEIQETERRFIAHELHDEIGQELTGLQFILEMGKEGTETNKLEALSEGQDLVIRLMSQVRELALNLHHSMIDDLGLLPALNTHFDRFQQKMGIQVKFTHRNLDRRFPSEVEISAFRLVQEALTNVARHSGAKEVEVAISADKAALKVVVADHGRGFDTQIMQDGSRSFGISGMRERTELVGGKFEVFSKPKKGTRISAIFPIGLKVERRKSDRQSPASR